MLFGVVLRMSTPGAARCTVWLPLLENVASESVRSVAATAITLGRAMSAGYVGKESLLVKLFPAAAIKRVPSVNCAEIASCSD